VNGTQVASLFGVIDLKDNMTPGLAKAKGGLQSMGSNLSKAGGEVQKFGARLSLMTAPLAAVGVYSVKAAIDWESAFAGVIKTVDATDEELADLERGLRDLAMGKGGSPVAALKDSAIELAGVAEAAGQLGVATEDILMFSEYMAILGMSTNVTAQEAAVLTAQFANITGMDMQDVDKFASSLVWLGNNAATTEKDILELSQRIAGAGSSAGLAEPEIMALATAALSLGFAPERAGTNLSTWLYDIVRIIGENGPELREFARIAGMDTSGFKALWEADPSAGLIKFLEGLNKLPDEEKFAVLEEFGWAAGTMTPLLLGLADNTELLTALLDGNTIAWDETTAAMEEASKRAETTESKINILKNRLDETAIIIGENLLPLLGDLAEDFGEFAIKIGEADQETLKWAVYLGLGLVALGPFVGLVGTLMKVAGGLVAVLGALGFVGTILAAVFAAGVVGNFGELSNHIRDIVKNAKEGNIVGMFQDIGNALIDIPEGAAKLLGDLIGIDASEGLAVYRDVWDNLKTIIEALPGAFEAFFAKTRTFTLPGGLITLHFTWKDIFDKITAIPAAIVNFISSLGSISVPQPLKDIAGIVGDIADFLGTGAGGGGTLTYEYEGHRGEGGKGLYHQTRDAGGPVRAGQAYFIGRSAQPELFVPSSSGDMYPAGTYGGQTVVIQALYVQDEDPQRWLDRLSDAARQRGSVISLVPA
jgi:TP901 family phage tail tape measure protein